MNMSFEFINNFSFIKKIYEIFPLYDIKFEQPLMTQVKA